MPGPGVYVRATCLERIHSEGTAELEPAGEVPAVRRTGTALVSEQEGCGALIGRHLDARERRREVLTGGGWNQCHIDNIMLLCYRSSESASEMGHPQKRCGA
jgi:hypothetical protein